MSPEDKAAWLKVGEAHEREFVKLARSLCLPIEAHPDKAVSPYGPDLLFDGRIAADLKRLTKPFYSAGHLFGVPPAREVTLNPGPRERYLAYPGFRIYFWVTYEDLGTNGIWFVRADSVRHYALHPYQNRVGDRRNNQEGLILSLDDMDCAYEFPTEVAA